MNENSGVFTVAREWIIKAENDLKTASYLLRMSDDCPMDAVCFHAQQCVEKYLKAFLVVKSIDFPSDYEPIQISEAKRSVTLARRVRKEIRSLLPKEVLSYKN